MSKEKAKICVSIHNYIRFLLLICAFVWIKVAFFNQQSWYGKSQSYYAIPGSKITKLKEKLDMYGVTQVEFCDIDEIFWIVHIYISDADYV